MSGSFVKHIPRTFFLGEQTVTYNEYRGPRAPSATLGAIGDIFVDFKAPALYARYVAGWTLWPGPQARNAALAHPAYPDHFLWASTVRSRVLWAPKTKMKKAVASAAEILTQIIEADGRRDSKLKRKMPEAPAGAGDAKKPRVSEPVPPEPARAGPAPSSTAEPSALVASGPETPAKPTETPSKAKAPPVIRPKEPIPQHVGASIEPAIPIIQPPVPPVASTSGTKPSAPVATITPSTKSPAPPVTSSNQPSLAVVPSATPATRRPAPPTASSTKSSATPATKLPAPPIASSTKPSVSVVPSITPATKPPAPPTTSRTKPPTTTSAVKASAPRTKSESSITQCGYIACHLQCEALRASPQAPRSRGFQRVAQTPTRPTAHPRCG
ncbi:hypothetical protein B0H17DRAFT_258048 [Mycena rosella]|uniref:Uncharacterized protein n=1 Tax=Mycena rosella TaxID=1033263 RepID=A0AAD7G8T0_MYCRO|nr:hypothetical protein B0H17DRAFT_258048 [Mycena rosella]